jgi:hypothetical protein
MYKQKKFHLKWEYFAKKEQVLAKKEQKGLTVKFSRVLMIRIRNA